MMQASELYKRKAAKMFVKKDRASAFSQKRGKSAGRGMNVMTNYTLCETAGSNTIGQEMVAIKPLAQNNTSKSATRF